MENENKNSFEENNEPRQYDTQPEEAGVSAEAEQAAVNGAEPAAEAGTAADVEQPVQEAPAEYFAADASETEEFETADVTEAEAEEFAPEAVPEEAEPEAGGASAYAELVSSLDETSPEQQEAAVIPPRKSNMGIIAVLSVVIIALLIVIAVLLAGTRPDFFRFDWLRNDAIGKVNGEIVNEGQIRVFLSQTESVEIIQGIQKQFGEDWQNADSAAIWSAFENFDWNAEKEDGVTYAEAAKNAAFDQAVLVHLKAKKAEEMGIGLTDSEKQQITFNVQQMETQYGVENMTKLLNENYSFRDSQEYIEFYTMYQAAAKFDSEYQADPSKFLTDEEKLAKYVNDDRATAKHILIRTVDDSGQALPEEMVAAARTRAEEVLNRAKAGEDFDALAEEFNEDPGSAQYPGGYAFGKGEMDPAFETAAFALGLNEISDLVETSYGYHIIKRVVGLAELEQQMKKEAKIKKNQKLLSAVKTTEEHQKEVEAANAAAAADASSESGTESALPESGSEADSEADAAEPAEAEESASR